MQTNTNFNAFSHWERINPVENRVEIAFDVGIDPAKTNIAQFRRDLFAMLNQDVLPQIAKEAPPGADLHADGSANSDFDVATVAFQVARGGGKWHKEGEGESARLIGQVAVALQTDHPIAAADALQTVRASVAGDIAALIAEGFGSFLSGKSVQAPTKMKAIERAAA